MSFTGIFAASILMGLAVSVQSYAQGGKTQALSGHVYEADTHEPIIGAAVMIKNTNTGVVTDVDGAFMIGINDPKAQIVVSTVGFKTQTISVEGRSLIDVYLELDSESLDDVVVVGYGTQKKATITGALSVIKTEDISRQTTPNLSNALGGVVPGLITRQNNGEPGYDSAAMLIRGLGTWASASPLVLVDGVERSLNYVNSSEIESFSVLKDASATAVYGMRGANGVILITTKKGQVGKPKVTVRLEATNLHGQRFYNYINSASYANLMNEASAVSGIVIPYADEDIEKFRNHSDPYLYPDVNWTDEILKKNAFQTMDEISVSGGNDIVRYYMYLGYSSEDGLFKEDPSYSYRTNSNAQRYTFRTNLDVNLSKNLTLELGISEIVQHRLYPGTDASSIFFSLNMVRPLSYPVRNPDGSLAGSTTTYENNSPYRLATNNGYAKQFRSTTQANATLRWDLGTLVTPGLSLEAKFSYDHGYFTEAFRRKTPTIKKFLGYDDAGQERYTIISEESSMGYAIESNSSTRAYYGEVRANYNRTFNKHTVGVLAMFSARDYQNLTANTSLANLPYRRAGFAGRFNYNYDQRYLAEFNFGYNGSENFARGKRFGFFPAFSAGWNISNEAFWKVPFMNHLKIRGSYGEVGSDANSAERFFYMSTVNTNANGYLFGDTQQQYPGYAEQAMGAPNATWEVSHKTDVGFDMEFFGGRFKLAADYFYEYRDKILLKRALIPDVMGAAFGDTPWANIGVMENRGVDGNAEFTGTTKGGFFYSLRGNFTFARNKIIEDDTVYHQWSYQDSRGRSANMVYGLTALGLFQNQEEIDNSPRQEFGPYTVGDVKYADLNGDNVINEYDKSYIGFGRTPEWMYGFGFTLGYKGFDLSLNFTGAANTTILINSPSMMPFSLEYPGYNVLQYYYDNRFIPGAADNSKALFPVVHAGNSSNNYQISTIYMRNANYLRLKTAEFGYNFPKTLLKRAGIESLRLFLNGNNLFCFDNVKIVDPETENMNVSRYPTQMATTFGIQIGF